MITSVSYRILGKHGSIEDMSWDNVPPLSIVTGENGAGKTQLLEVLAAGYGQSIFGTLGMRNKLMGTALEIDGKRYMGGNAFYADASWIPSDWGSASIEIISAEAHRLYDVPATNAFSTFLDDPLYIDWEEITTSVDDNVTTSQIIRPGWDKFESRLTPARLAQGTSNQNNLAFLFLSYEVLRAAAKDRAARNSEDTMGVIEQLGDPPWETFNTFCKEADVGFEIVAPSIERPTILARPTPPYQLQLRDIKRGTVVPVSEASSGERIMLSIVAWRYLAETWKKSYDVIILDEPDAHLHPSLVRKFLSVLQSVLVERHGARVIITTHSPSTVALAPKGSVFELQRHGTPRIVPVKNSAEVVAKLTGGLVAVDTATRFIVLEGPSDPPFYRGLWTLMVEAGLTSFPGVSFSVRDGCSKVKETVRFLRAWDFERFYGILDRDASPNQNMPEEGIFVHSRNGIENYVFDPLNIWLCLWLERSQFHAQLYQIPSLRQGNGSRLKEEKPSELQLVVDSVWNKILASSPEIEPHLTDLVPVYFKGGLQLQYPRWFLECDDHSLAASVRQAFSPYPFPPNDLHQSYMTLNLIPQEFWDIFSKIAKPLPDKE
ncbi:AAA family ATPase [Collimonas humicola]|uniref:AAA family ATPase n=1 Tax=Collimonas humicola TaxID=2825886 RepID=UPI001B8CD58B|nr:AAA family ATPase [Collimonas humicola]